MRFLKNPFGRLSLIFFLFGAVILLKFEKGDIVLWLNENHSVYLDQLMKYWTFLGDGFMLLPLFIGMLLYRYYYAISAVFLSLFVLLFSQGLKLSYFRHWPRPTAYFDSSVAWNKVEGVTIATLNTFPSGHTISAFALFFFLSLVLNRRGVYIFSFILAIGVGISRVYLLQHFFVDVYFGAFFGMIAAIVALLLPGYLLGNRRTLKLKSSSLIIK